MMKSLIKVFSWIVGLFLLIAPWVYHLVHCFKNQEYVLLVVGGLIAPIGWIHGCGAFFGWW